MRANSELESGSAATEISSCLHFLKQRLHGKIGQRLNAGWRITELLLRASLELKATISPEARV
jgi:hypothetical protein